MTQQEPARASWDALEAPWRAAIDMAWQSYLDGGIAVGAVLTDAAGAVLGEGVNQRFAGRTRGLLAHAELGALAALPPGKDRARDSVLYTTLSPVRCASAPSSSPASATCASEQSTRPGSESRGCPTSTTRCGTAGHRSTARSPADRSVADDRPLPQHQRRTSAGHGTHRTTKRRSSPRREPPLPRVSAPARHRRASPGRRLGPPRRLDPVTDAPGTPGCSLTERIARL